MLKHTPDIPTDDSLGDLAVAFAPDAILEACRRDLNRVPVGERDGWSECRFLEAFYHPRRYFRAAYALLSDPSTPVNRYWPEATIIYAHARPRATMSARGQLITVRGLDVEAYAFPNDRRLRSVRRFQGRESAVETWQRWLAASGDAFRIAPDTLRRVMIRYVPEKRWVLRLRCRGLEGDGANGKRSIAVRCATIPQCREVVRRHRIVSACAAKSGVRVPALSGYDESLGIMATEWIRGDDLATRLSTNHSTDLISAVAAATSRFHDLPAPLATVNTWRAGRDVIESSCSDLGIALPEFRSALDAIQQVAREAPADSEYGEDVLLHDDLHPWQFRVKGADTAILDLDRACRGSAAADVANFVIQLECLGERSDSDLSVDSARTLAKRFLHAYEIESGRAFDDAELRFHSVVALLKLANGMMRHIRPDWRSLAGHCIRRASELLVSPGQSVLTGGPKGASL
ncbi:MAG TPA: aminoglycoside phosphotransferase family protein [Phycisphaerae bacterium]|nr:aminoglycoside phosphotransferase family protein [Phycisphaerae bacterium]HRW52975.1 aminoglycoside phosphotransferase family protein [Phycisphaerae bacterium]